MKNTDLYMTVREQAQALNEGGFPPVVCLLEKGGLVLHRAATA